MPFIDFAVVIQAFYLLLPFIIISLFSLVAFILNLIKYKRNIFKQSSTLLTLVLPVFLLSQTISVFTVNKIQRFRSNQIIKKINNNELSINSNPTISFGITYYKLQNDDFVVQYERGFLVKEKYNHKKKKWDSYGWND